MFPLALLLASSMDIASFPLQTKGFNSNSPLLSQLCVMWLMQSPGRGELWLLIFSDRGYWLSLNAPVSRESVRGRQQYSRYLVFKENTCHHNLCETCHKVCLCTHEISAYMQVGTTESCKQSSSCFPDPSQSLVANVFYSDGAVCGHSAQRDL